MGRRDRAYRLRYGEGIGIGRNRMGKNGRARKDRAGERENHMGNADQKWLYVRSINGSSGDIFQLKDIT